MKKMKSRKAIGDIPVEMTVELVTISFNNLEKHYAERVEKYNGADFLKRR